MLYMLVIPYLRIRISAVFTYIELWHSIDFLNANLPDIKTSGYLQPSHCIQSYIGI